MDLSKCFFHFGLEKLKQREEELNAFHTGQNEVEEYYKQKTSQTLAEFDQEHKEASRDKTIYKDIYCKSVIQ